MTAYATRADAAAPLPSLVKIDISPQCSLACPHCLHADPAERGRSLLDRQEFKKSHRMDLAQFEGVIDQIKDKAVAISLFYYGDPLAHPQIDEMIAVARAARLEVHLTSHFSYNFTEARIRRLVDAGLSHITVAVDGATQESYEQTRVRGRLDWVLANLKMMSDYKHAQKLKHPFIEVQHILFPHHAPDELKRVRDMAEELRVDTFTSFEGLRFDERGDLYNVVDDDPQTVCAGPARGAALTPHCHWPFSSTVIRYDGDVIPCCLWRSGRQYVPDEERDPHIKGNVFDQSLQAIWNSPAYSALRRQVSNPRRASKEGAAATFCDGCPRLHMKPDKATAPAPGEVYNGQTAPGLS
ncbi:MAG: radical SAM protein [Pseudomonadota bacterium]